MDAVLGVFTAALPFVVAVLLIVSAMWPRRFGRRGLSSGAVGAFDEIWAPEAAEARAIWEAEQELPIEIPSPDGENPTDRDLSAGRITITPR